MSALRRIPVPILVLALTTMGAAPLTAQPLPPVDAGAVGMSAERLARLDRTLDGYVEAGELAGGVVMVTRRGRLVHEHVFGLRDVASGDPVARYLPAFGSTTVETEDGRTVPAERRVTVRDLLTHTAGVDYGMGRPAWEAAGITGWYFADREEPIRATVERMAGLPFRAQPGERWTYGYSTDILGAVLERASGMPLDRLLQDRILGPLGMEDTWFYVPPEEAGRMVTVYGSEEDGLGFGLGFEILEDPGLAGRFGSPGAYGWGGAYHSTYWVDPVQELVVVYMTQLIPARVDDHARLRPLVYQSVVEGIPQEADGSPPRRRD